MDLTPDPCVYQATPSEWAHLNKRYVEGGECPKDWLLAQTLMFFKARTHHPSTFQPQP